ncbi:MULTISPECIES: hypothetical protein [unclassified Pseudoalteromonas]|uniref:hypothetical protein n=1 Tax=unclassified Pseudoalteromonas TaxID=194690 RepID=UPI000CF6F73C|nr:MULTISPECIES: hypothetical protein [unclassified Pseudoalteromonas]
MNTFTKAAILAASLTLSMGAHANSLTDDIERAVKEAANEAFATLISTQKAALSKATQAMFESNVQELQSQGEAKSQAQPEAPKKGDDHDA